MKTLLQNLLVVLINLFLIGCSNNDKIFKFVMDGNEEEIKEYLGNKGNPNLRDERKISLVYAAATNNQPKIIKLLYEKGADINLAADSGETPVLAASATGNIQVVKYLAGIGADLNIVDYYGMNIAAKATWAVNAVEILTFLHEKGCDLDKPDHSGSTPLFWANYNGSIEAIKFLVEHNANINRINKNNYTVLDCAIKGEGDKKEIIYYLKSKGAKTAAELKEENTEGEGVQDSRQDKNPSGK